MDEGVKFVFAIGVIAVIAALTLGGAGDAKDLQTSTINKAESKVSRLLN